MLNKLVALPVVLFTCVMNTSSASIENNRWNDELLKLIDAQAVSENNMTTGPIKKIPFNRTSTVGNEFEYVIQVMQKGPFAGNGPFSKQCVKLLETQLDVPRVLLTTSCTTALDMAALLLDIQAGDEVIMPTFTYAATATAFELRGAKPVFVDMRSDTFNMDEQKIEGLITDNTKAIVVMHYGGVGCEMDTIMAIASKYDLPVVEDNAHGLFGKYKGRPLGTFGCLAAHSFHETKNFTCGQGGALFINDLSLQVRAEIISECGTDRARFLRGEVGKYGWVDHGSNFILPEIAGAFLYGQLERWDQIQAKRKETWDYYNTHLQNWAAYNDVVLQSVPSYCEQAYHIFFMVMPSENEAHALSERLKSEGITAYSHYCPLNLSEMGMKYGAQPGDCPVAEDLSRRMIRLPLYYSLSAEDREFVVKVITNN